MEQEIARVVKFFAKPSVAAIEMTAGPLRKGDQIRVKGHTTDFTQVVDSIQVDNQDVEEANAGDMVGIKTADRVREKDVVLKVVADA